MKLVWLMIVLAAAIGTTVAWWINYNKYGQHGAEFGPLTLDGSVNATNVIDVVSQAYPSKLPKAEIVGDSLYDFGAMGPGDEGEHTFIIRNTGENTLNLKLGATSCKCTLGELDKDSLEPGEETKVTLTWTIKTELNAFKQSAEIRTNDPANLALRLEVAGQVVRQIAIVPDAWTFGEVATGEPFEFKGKIYSYFEDEVVPTVLELTSEELNKLADIQVKPFTAGEADGAHSTARQAFEVITKVKPGMRQGALAVSFKFGFQLKDKNGNIIPPEEGDTDPNDYAVVEVAGRIVGPLSMIVGTKLREASGSYIYDFGKLDQDDSLKAKAFVVLKGSEKENTKLTIGEVTPAEVIRATLGDPISRGTMVLYPLELEIIPSDKPLEYLGKSRNDFASIWIESDNPKVGKMRLAAKFAVDARP